MTSELAIVVGGAVAAGFVQGLSGFAFALVALSVWAWAVDPQIAAPMAVFGSLIGQLLALPMLWRGIQPRRAAPFILGGIVGVPLGVMLLRVLDPGGFKLGLGIFLLLYCPGMLFAPDRLALRWGGRWADAAIGWVGGVLGGIGGLAGGVPTLWCTLRGWDKDTQRGVMLGFNISMHVMTLASYVVAGGVITGRALQMFAIIAPALAIPVVLGTLVFRRLDQRAFRRVVLAMLFLSGVALVGSRAAALFRPGDGDHSAGARPASGLSRSSLASLRSTSRGLPVRRASSE
ncbi:MAG: TSUP family transporter [Alphaproteobacteria bacterium]|nr:TSUP family transporter [Alphaproteobacteria bacterium]